MKLTVLLIVNAVIGGVALEVGVHTRHVHIAKKCGAIVLLTFLVWCAFCMWVLARGLLMIGDL